MSKGKWTRYDPRLPDEVARLMFAGLSARRILEALTADPPPGVDTENLPDERTIRRWMIETRANDTSPAWAPLAATDAGQSARVLPVLAAVLETSAGRSWLSTDLVKLVDRVVLAVPSAPPLWAYALARGYQWARERERETRGLDLTLALAPWMDARSAATWVDLLREMGDRVSGWPGGAPGLLALAARLPPPGWATGDRQWGAYLWELLLEGVDPDNGGDGASQPLADSNLTAEPVDCSRSGETEVSKN